MRLQDILEGIQGIGTVRGGRPALGGHLWRCLDGETKAQGPVRLVGRGALNEEFRCVCHGPRVGGVAVSGTPPAALIRPGARIGEGVRRALGALRREGRESSSLGFQPRLIGMLSALGGGLPGLRLPAEHLSSWRRIGSLMDGYRESEYSWLELLLDLKQRG